MFWLRMNAKRQMSGQRMIWKQVVGKLKDVILVRDWNFWIEVKIEIVRKAEDPRCGLEFCYGIERSSG